MDKAVKNPGLKFKIIILALCITTAGIIFGLYALKSAVRNFQNSKTRLDEVKRDVARLDMILQDKKTFEQDIKLIRGTLPATYYDISFFSSELRRLADKYGVALQINADKKKKEEKQTYDSVIYAMELSGGYSAIANYFSDISKLPFHTQMSDMQLNADSGHLTAKARIKLFVEK